MTAEAKRDEGDGRHGQRSVPAAAAPSIDARARQILEDAWRTDGPGGFCVPHATTYPWQWLWDSCFPAVVWCHLGDERAVVELETALSAQDADGFVPPLRYVPEPSPHQAFWAWPATPSILQPPTHRPATAATQRAATPGSHQCAHR